MKNLAITYGKILVTHDGSELASLAIPHANKLAQAFDAKITLIQVVDSIIQITAKMQPPHISHGGVYVSDDIEEVYQQEKKAALENLVVIKNKLVEAGCPDIEIKIAEGSPGEEIVTWAKKIKVDLVIMSTHGRSGLGRALLGSVADYVVRNASCPVLLVHPH